MKTKFQLDSDVADLMESLDAAAADYVVIGAHALGAHGIIRATADFDLLVRATPVNSSRVYRALLNFGAPLKAHKVPPTYFSKPERVYQMGLPPKRIDIITSISGVETDEAFATAILLPIGNERRRVLSLETLLKNKKATGRPKDLLDVALLKKQLKLKRSAPKRRTKKG